MQTPPHLGWESQFISALRIHLNAVIPIVALLVKVLVRVFSREDFAEVMRSVANLPLELLLISMSFMLGALSGISDSYVIHLGGNQSNADLFAIVAVIVIFFLCLFINIFTKFLRILGGKLFVAFKQFRELFAQPRLPEAVLSKAIVGRIVWAMGYCVLMVLVLVLNFGISVATLAYVLHLIQ